MLDSYLETSNLQIASDGVERHPLIPFLPQNARVIFLGSFPPQRKRWCMDFYYPNFINDHWRIEGKIFFGDKDFFVDAEHKCFKREEIVRFLENKGIALYDSATSVRRLMGNASDKFLEIVEPTDLCALMTGIPHCRAIVTTGQKATETVCSSLGVQSIPKVGMSVCIPDMFTSEGEQLCLYRLPSSSRAYPLSFDKKVEAYEKMFREVGLLDV